MHDIYDSYSGEILCKSKVLNVDTGTHQSVQ